MHILFLKLGYQEAKRWYSKEICQIRLKLFYLTVSHTLIFNHLCFDISACIQVRNISRYLTLNSRGLRRHGSSGKIFTIKAWGSEFSPQNTRKTSGDLVSTWWSKSHGDGKGRILVVGWLTSRAESLAAGSVWDFVTKSIWWRMTQKNNKHWAHASTDTCAHTQTCTHKILWPYK